jgi:hypothetical protein
MPAVTGGILRRDLRQHQVPRAGGGAAGVPEAAAAREYCVALTAAAACARRIGERRAARRYRETLVRCQDLGHPGNVARLRRTLGANAFAPAWRAGEAMPTDAVADDALRMAGESEPGRARNVAPETSISLESVSRLSGSGP